MPQTSKDAIERFVNRGLLIRFDPGTVFGTANAHFGVVVNSDPKSQQLVVVICASSKVEKRINNAKARGMPSGTIVRINARSHPHFSKDTVFDCNYAEKIDFTVLAAWLAESKIELPMYDDTLDEVLVDEICAGIMISDMVAPEIKDLLI